MTVVTPSEDEFTKFWEIPYGQPVENYMPYLRRLAAMGPEVVVLKMGGEGRRPPCQGGGRLLSGAALRAGR